jgi:glycosyltransferase involved in cell wall biosynthesis
LEELAAAQVQDSSRVFYLPNGCNAKATEDRGLETGSISSLSPVSGLLSAPSDSVREKYALGDAPTVLLYSRFWEFRLERVVTLVREVAAHLPQARWLMVGKGLHGEDKLLTTQLAEADLAEYVRFTGWLPLEQVPAYFAAANVAVYPYDNTLLNRTKCSVKLINLLEAGLPVVADAVGQNVEYIQNGVSGLLTPAEDDRAMAAALVALLQNAGQQKRLGQAARQFIAENFNWTYLAQIAERAYCY